VADDSKTEASFILLCAINMLPRSVQNFVQIFGTVYAEICVSQIQITHFLYSDKRYKQKQSTPCTGLLQVLWVPGGSGSISRQSAHEGGKVVRPVHWLPGTHFC
jgi:hypothetical protein